MTNQDKVTFHKWFPKNSTNLVPKEPDFRLFCLHGAGMEQQTFTSFNKNRNINNTLVEFCISQDIEFLAVQLPGRMSRSNEECITNIRSIVTNLMDIIQILLEAPKFVPYAIIGFSMGCIIGYELIKMIKSRHLPLPEHFFITCMLSPDYPVDSRPWKEAKFCNSREFQKEMKLWGANEAIMNPEIWKIYEGLLRADMAIIDDYRFHPYDQKLDIDITCYYASQDKLITLESMKGWSNLFQTKKEVDFLEIPGPHSFPYDNKSREIWMKQIVLKLSKILSDMIIV